ncbi:MAG: hypothetical protein WCN98_20805 [Verrucomicrobiaceae bacterium]
MHLRQNLIRYFDGWQPFRLAKTSTTERDFRALKAPVMRGDGSGPAGDVEAEAVDVKVRQHFMCPNRIHDLGFNPRGIVYSL